MSTKAAWNVQVAIYGVLTALVPAIVVYDQVPDAAAMPYVVIEDIAEYPDETLVSQGRRCIVALHTWSRYSGAMEVQEIIDWMIDALHHQPLTITGWHHVDTRLETSIVLRDPDGITRHGVTQFRIWVQGV